MKLITRIYLLGFILMFSSKVICKIDGPMVTPDDRREWAKQKLSVAPIVPPPVVYAMEHPTPQEIDRAWGKLAMRFGSLSIETRDPVTSICGLLSANLSSMSCVSRTNQIDKERLDSARIRLRAVMQGCNLLRHQEPSKQLDNTRVRPESVAGKVLSTFWTLPGDKWDSATALILDHLDFEWSRLNFACDQQGSKGSSISRFKLELIRQLTNLRNEIF